MKSPTAGRSDRENVCVASEHKALSAIAPEHAENNAPTQTRLCFQAEGFAAPWVHLYRAYQNYGKLLCSCKPLCGGEARSTGPQGNRQGGRFLFVRTGVLSKSPASAHGLGGRCPASAKWGGLSFGDFSLAIQRKVTRTPREGESSLAFEFRWLRRRSR
jgi:hypothetical protein